MPRPLPSLTAPERAPDLALLLERAATALARLDARICACSLATIWHRCSASSGLARALQLEGEEIEEIDIFAAEMGVVLAHRLVSTRGFDVLDQWAALRGPLAPTDDLGALALPCPALRA